MTTDIKAEMADADNLMFGDQPPTSEPAAPEVPVAESQQSAEPDVDVANLFKAAGLELPGAASSEPAQQQLPLESQPAEQVAEEQQPSQQEMMQAYMQQQAQLSQQLVELQRQQAQQAQQIQQPQQPNLNDPAQLAEMMNSVGLDPTNSTDVFMFRADMERRIQQQQYEGQIAQMEGQLNHMREQAQYAQSEASIGPQVDATLKVYGDIPAKISENIKHHAAVLLAENLGVADQAQAIEVAVQPYLPLLQMVQQQPGNAASASTPAAPVAQTHSAPKQNVDAQAVLAAALSGGSSGHGPTLDDLDVKQYEALLFRNN